MTLKTATDLLIGYWAAPHTWSRESPETLVEAIVAAYNDFDPTVPQWVAMDSNLNNLIGWSYGLCVIHPGYLVMGFERNIVRYPQAYAKPYAVTANSPDWVREAEERMK
jgi:hypothetical protein